jgi:hypothetical protein
MLARVTEDASELPTEVVTGKTMTRHFASLDAFRGNAVKLRFRYTYGGDDYIDLAPLGWNIDDVKIVATDWHAVGTTAGTSFTLNGRPGGRVSYRVTALYTDSLAGPPSASVTTSMPSVRGGRFVGRPAGPMPATGLGDPSTIALMLLVAAALLGRLRRSPA